MRFGVHTGLQGATFEELAATWRHVEGLGFEWISVADHFVASFGTDAPYLEAVVSHAALAIQTTSVACGSLVYSVGYRSPAVLANAACALDQLSGGRAVLGVGAGWLEEEYRAYGLPFPDPATRVRMLDEAVACIRGLLDQDTTDFDGEFFRLEAAPCDPKPVQDRLPIWVGGAGKKTMDIAARRADGWNLPFPSVELFGARAELVRRRCDELGRDPSGLTLSVNVGLAWDEAAREAQFASTPHLLDGVLGGGDQQVLDQVAAYADRGAEWLILATRSPFDHEAIDRFARDVMPPFTGRRGA